MNGTQTEILNRYEKAVEGRFAAESAMRLAQSKLKETQDQCVHAYAERDSRSARISELEGALDNAFFKIRSFEALAAVKKALAPAAKKKVRKSR